MNSCPKCGSQVSDFLKTRIKFQFRVFFLVTIDQEVQLPISKILTIKDIDINAIKGIIKAIFPDIIIPDVSAPKLNFYHCWNCGQSNVEIQGTSKAVTLNA